MKKIILSLLAAVSVLASAFSCTENPAPEHNSDKPDEEEPFEYPTTYTFSHPCGLVSATDIQRIKNRIAAADSSNPVYAAWMRLCDNRYAQKDYAASPVETLVRGDDTNTGTNENYMVADRDAAAAFQLALRYRISGDADYAATAAKILNDWARTCKRITANDNNQYLLAGFQGYQFANAAELLRDYTLWSDTEQNAFKQWLMDVWYSKNRWFIENHGGSNVCPLHYWSNWELANLASILAIGIYTENADMISFVYKNFREGAGSGSIKNMIPYSPVADPDGKTKTIAQSMESGRDQGHATLVVSMCAELCQMAWNLGIDFWGMDDNRVLAMCEYTAKYNCAPDDTYLCTDMPFTTYEYCPSWCSCSNHSHGAIHTEVSSAGRGKIRPSWELVYAHYSKVKGLAANYTYYSRLFAQQLRYTDGILTGDGGAGDNRYGTNSSAFDQIGWGTLMFYQGE